MKWNGNLWSIDHVDNSLILQVGGTASETEEYEECSDKNIKFCVHKQRERIVGYVATYRKAKTIPRIYEGPFYVSLHYNSPKKINDERRNMHVMYHDSAVRLLTFENEYMLVMRKMP